MRAWPDDVIDVRRGITALLNFLSQNCLFRDVKPLNRWRSPDQGCALQTCEGSRHKTRQC